MGLFGKFVGAPSKDKFARMVIDAIRQAGETAPIDCDTKGFRLVSNGEASRTFNLSNVYDEYCGAPRPKRSDVLRNITKSWFSDRKKLPTDYEDVHPDLLPAVRNRADYEISQLDLQREVEPEFKWHYQVLGEHLGISLVYDLPEALVHLQDHHLKSWGVTFDEALEAAQRNLREMSNNSFENPASGVWRSPWRDNHDASRLILIDLIRELSIRGDPIAMLPNRDTLLVTGSEDENGLALIAEMAEEAMQEPRPLTAIAFRLDGNSWVPFLPRPDSPHFNRMKMLSVQSLGQGYADQKVALDALHEKKGEDAFVAAFSARQKSDTGEVSSYCVWSEGVDTLLPHTDHVMFFRLRGNEDGEVVGSASWDTAKRQVGHLMEPVGGYPERWRVRRFPSDAELKAMCE
jgi:hypothetical protein